ncbi:MAG: pyridine nucleotide-disulfide oxidoreductase [Candidatus Lokiarchaeota archaeon]|nr:pyridine nucleotide-disulfide oxidoreductase [Candidatus Lokiarchaeota archaeon]MBD3339525.1 pyridine nucleotide-disulfide oxidoreductase [Candidatus Lokiarchaeota archaeon]
MKKNLVFVGGGHAHLTCISNIKKFIDLNTKVTVISPSPFQYYSGMGPGLLSGKYIPSETRFDIKSITENEGGTFIEDKVVKIISELRQLILESGKKMEFDIASFNIGSEIITDHIDISKSNLVLVKPVENLIKARKEIMEMDFTEEKQFCVIGGGPAGIEITSNLWKLISDMGVNATIYLISATKLLSNYPNKARKKVLKSLVKRTILVMEGQLVSKIEENRVILNSGKQIPSDLTFLATGVRPPPLFKDSELTIGADGSLLVNESLHSIEQDNMLGGGDCISIDKKPLDKVGVYAVKENPILFNNILKLLQEKKELESFDPQENYLLILNMGNGKGIAWRGNFVFGGKFVLRLKDYIDQKFMRKYQI